MSLNRQSDFPSTVRVATDEIQDLIRKYGLEEDPEHVIIPIRSADSSLKRCFLLKRRFMRVVFGEGHFHDYPLEEIIEATVLYPETPLKESILLVHKEPEVHAPEETDTIDRRGEGEKENTD
jgi:hypothetical protein